MAPNISLKDIREESEETSQEALLAFPEASVAVDVPEVFLPHLPHELQNPDSPNLHFLQRHDIPSARSTLRAYRPTPATRGPDALLISEPSDITVLEDAASVIHRQPTVTSDAPEISTRVHSLQFTKEPVFRTAGEASGKVIIVQEQAGGPGTEPSSTLPTSTHSIDPGVLKLPGHEPEAPADLVLVHHERAIDTRNQTGLNGIFVRDDTTSITPEGATALILVGICTVFLVFICLIFFIQKVRRQRLERKVEQDGDVVKPQTTYEAAGSSHYHPNPLSLLPPALLHALTSLTLSAHHERHEDHLPPSFLTMEPPQSTNSLGRLWFSVYYDYVESTLVLRILHARYTKGRGSSTNPGDVWVEACVLTPMNMVKGSTKTGTRRASSAPVFNQTFRFKVGDEEVTQYLLRLTLYDRHPQNGEKAVGSVIVPLSTVDLCSSATISRDLQ